MPRLFTALEIPASIGENLASLRGGLPGARWISPENYHITLRFIGDIDDGTARDVTAELGQVRRREPINITVDRLDSFGGSKPRAVVVAAELSEELRDLQSAHERAMRRLGLPAETRKYAPHVTLARLRDASPMAVAHYIAALGRFPKETFTARRVVLMSSRDSVGGGPYVVEAAYPLG